MCETVKIDLFDLINSSGRAKSLSIEYPESVYSVDGVSYEILKQSKIELRLESVKVGHIHLEGSFDLTLVIPCDRCLKDVECPLNLVLSRELITKDKADIAGDDEDDQFSVLDGTEFDIVSYVNQEILMNLPSKILCDDACKGLCPVCGCDQNVSECDCDTFVMDPRMAGIMDIFKGNKEV